MGRKKRFCNKHGMSHFPPTGKKCPGPEFGEISLSGEVKDITEQQGGDRCGRRSPPEIDPIDLEKTTRL